MNDRQSRRRGQWLLPILAVLCCAAATEYRGNRVYASADYTGSCPSGGTNCYQAGYAGLTPLEQQGRDTWYFWTGGDKDADGNVVGDQELWRSLAKLSHGTFDLLQAIDSRYRGQRFQLFGVLSDPDCTKATAPDQYGLWLDNCSSPDVPQIAGVPGKPSGVIGLVKFDNPKFNPTQWDVKRYMADPASVEPPYIVGMACAFCHVGFHPQHPPADPENPQWHNLHPGIGNQYLREQAFNTAKYPASRGLQEKDFQWQITHAEPPGTAETSQVATDHINNPNVINNIANLNNRPTHAEVTADGVTRNIYHILKDGADSVGAACLDDPTEVPGKNDTACAGLRVYVNIGMCADIFENKLDPVYGLKRDQAPFIPKAARQKSKPCDEAWTATEGRVAGMEAFLRTLPSLPLSGADSGQQYVPSDQKILAQGKAAFASQCARCHSSKRPPAGYAGSETDWYRTAVLQDDFLENNFLSDDVRHSVVEIGTNIKRAMGSNAIQGHIWQEFSSETYKNLPPVEISNLINPLHPDLVQSAKATGGRGYYRTPTLANVWATAPFFHNNALGAFNGDPSVKGRLAAYQDAMEKLLWPQRRAGLATISRTTRASSFQFPDHGSVCIAKNTPVDIVTNVDTVPPEILQKNNALTRLLCHLTGTGAFNDLFLAVDNAPDFVEDRGHTFGIELPDADKLALIEYMKTF